MLWPTNKYNIWCCICWLVITCLLSILNFNFSTFFFFRFFRFLTFVRSHEVMVAMPKAKEATYQVSDLVNKLWNECRQDDKPNRTKKPCWHSWKAKSYIISIRNTQKLRTVWNVWILGNIIFFPELLQRIAFVQERGKFFLSKQSRGGLGWSLATYAKLQQSYNKATTLLVQKVRGPLSHLLTHLLTVTSQTLAL